MKAKLLLSLVLVCSISVLGQVKENPQPSPQTHSTIGNNSQFLPIRKVVLYSNGMVYIERRGTISGNADINLSFKQSQVDDVLKSMVVLDLGQGKIGAVSYNASVPSSARTAEIPFNIESATENDSGGMAGVLSQLQGARVLVTTDTVTMSGSILNIAKKRKVSRDKDGETTSSVDCSLVISSESGEISSFDLSEIRTVKLLDEETKNDVSEFANATASARRRDAKTISISSEGTGQREMIVSYTLAAPIWKTSYRVVLDEEGKPFFQGWAIVDNVSDEDWQKVQLSLVSGSPISFIKPLQNPLYRHRPVIDIPEDLSLEPQIYDSTGAFRYKGNEGQSGGIGFGSGTGSAGDQGPARVQMDDEEPPPTVKTGVSELLASESAGVQTAAKGSEFGDLFEYRIAQPISVQRNRSALIPIVQTKMEGERVSIYREDVKKDRPMSGLMLNNTSNLTLEGGAMTVLDRDAYAGEAEIERLKPKEKRLISFAVDLGTLITVNNEEIREPAKFVKAVNGTFQVHYFTNDKKTYTLTNQTDRQKVIYIEHPIRNNWFLSDETTKPFDVTQDHYRFRIELKPFESKPFTISERQPLADSYRISALERKDLDLFLTRRYIDNATKQNLLRLIELRDEISQIDRKLRALDEEAKEIAADQSRLRENIGALTKTSGAKLLISRYISKANQQESRIEAISRERQSLKLQRERSEANLATEIKNFELK